MREQAILNFFKQINIQKRLNKLAQKYENKKIVIYAASLAFELLCRHYDMSKFNIVGIGDMRFEDSEKWCNYDAYSPDTFMETNPDVIFVGAQNSRVIEHFFKNELFVEYGVHKYELLFKLSLLDKLKIFINTIKGNKS